MEDNSKAKEIVNSISQQKTVESLFLRDSKPDKEEIKRLYERMNKNHEIRNQLIMFSFTSVIASLGAALAIDDINALFTFLFLFPLVILIPFQARISYYRLEEAHIITYIRTLSPENEKYSTLCRRGFKEDAGIGMCQYRIIAWLVNHELVCLSVLSAIVFWFKFFSSVKEITRWTLVLGLVPPVILLYVLFQIANSTYNYGNMTTSYEKKLQEIKEEYYRQTIEEDIQEERASS